MTLKYSIAEAYRYAAKDSAWDHGHEYSLTVRFNARYPGLLWFYSSSSCQDLDTEEWSFQPDAGFLELDQRNEPVYAATIEVS